jgi:predicted nucleic acid-binding protein
VCWPVITEAAWLLRAYPKAVHQLLQSTDSGFVELLPLAGKEAKGPAEVMKTYQDIQPQLADAALIYLANREGIDTIFTLNWLDFSVYRSAGKRPFRIVPRLADR